MARAPLLQLSDISLTFGGNPLFSGLDLVVQNGDKLALVGRNGSGKSTLMKVMARRTEPDKGQVATPAGISVGYLEQDPDFAGYATLGDFALRGLGPADSYRVEAAAEGLGFDPDTSTATASGGERRRAALAGFLAEAPDVMLIDEPTNHLDISAIGWLEQELQSTRSALILISHDRAILHQVCRGVLWIDRGNVRSMTRGFGHFEEWRDKVWAEEDLTRHKLDRKIKAEARWAVEGISARRRRNQGRLRALADLRATRADAIRRQGTAELALDSGPKSGKLVLEAQSISKSYGETRIVRDFSLRLQRGDRVAMVGPNGSGKTTLINVLIGEAKADSGTLRLGTNLTIARFDQNRAALQPDATLWDSLAGDPEIGVIGRSDQVMVRGAPRHVVGYLKDFLFDEAQARAPVRSLSGGEKARLLLAKLMARTSNFLVLDEPTNDLDIETLDLLQDLLADYEGTVLLVSHDRDFIDRVATMTIALEGRGRATIYAGGWSDYQSQKQEAAVSSERSAKPRKIQTKDRPSPVAQKGLTFTETHRLEKLPAEIERLEAEIAKLSELLSDPDLYATAPVKFAKASEALTERQKLLAAAEEEWLLLEEKASG
ncbi:MAG: ABC-F family ATP-binding cassette domain-containing protein [Pseudomonadota bacterium]